MSVSFDADVAIVGAGFAGLMCADRLSRLGYRVAVLEKAEAALAGTSSRNEGWLHAGTYHALSVRDPDEARAIAQRCNYGWSEIQRRFPESIELEDRKAVAVLPDETLDRSLSRWAAAGVRHRRIAEAELAPLRDWVRVGADETAFAVDDLAVNTRMLGAGIIAELTARGVQFFFGADIHGRDDDILDATVGGEKIRLAHRFLVSAVGYATPEACASLGLPAMPIRLWRSHLLTVPRVAPVSAFGVAPGQAAMINHGGWSIIGLNEDAVVVERPTFTVDPAVAERLEAAVRARFPRADLEAAHRTACVKVDYAPRRDDARSLNVRMVPAGERALVVLPGKMTETPYCATTVAAHVFGVLGRGNVTHRPIDRLVAVP